MLSRHFGAGNVECAGACRLCAVPCIGGGISGIVSDDQGPLVGAAVMVKGSTGGVSTGLDGEYALSGVKIGDVIVFSLLGYNDVEIVYEGQPALNATLEVS